MLQFADISLLWSGAGSFRCVQTYASLWFCHKIHELNKFFLCERWCLWLLCSSFAGGDHVVQVISVIAEQLVDGASLVGSVGSWALFRGTIDLVSGSGIWWRLLQSLCTMDKLQIDKAVLTSWHQHLQSFACIVEDHLTNHSIEILELKQMEIVNLQKRSQALKNSMLESVLHCQRWISYRSPTR